MKKTLILAAIMIIIPFATFAHGGEFADADEQTSTEAEMMKEDLNHEEMEGLMKKFMINGSLSEVDADSMLKHINELIGSDMEGGMMGMTSDTDAEGSHGKGGGMGGDMSSGGMVGGGMMWMGMLHALVAVTSTVWLIAGVMYLANMRRQSSVQTTTE